MRRGRIKLIISGGGTGGHIFPAISIANAVKRVEPEAEILFVGALGRMEMERVPMAGYPIEGLPMVGLKRRLSLENLKLPFKICRSLKIASEIIDRFKPDVAVGVGGYASWPTLWVAGRRKIPYIIQEQNSFAGVANRALGKRAAVICVAYPEMERFFQREKIVLTGNPVRDGISRTTAQMRQKGLDHFGITNGNRAVLVTGGSLGAGTLNSCIKKYVLENEKSDINIIWQCGRYYFGEIEAFNRENPREYIRCFEFIDNMDFAFAAADVVVSRAGAGVISELCAAGKATIFVPSPNVSEDHQTHNAMTLVSRDAALIVPDREAEKRLMEELLDLIAHPQKIEILEKNIHTMALPGSAEVIAGEILKLSDRYRG